MIDASSFQVKENFFFLGVYLVSFMHISRNVRVLSMIILKVRCCGWNGPTW